MAQDVFLRPRESYKRDLSHLREYVHQQAFYCSRVTGKPASEFVEPLRAYVKASIKNPVVAYYERGENGDKSKKTNTLLGYLKQTMDQGDILAPTFTTYVSQKVFVSPFAEFMIFNKKRRGVAKKAGFKAKQAGNYDLAAFQDVNQNAFKTFNNAGSGTLGSKGSVLFNPTSHSTCTSSVRTQTSIANASNEKFLEGNRYYPNVDFILNNLVSICSNYNEELMTKVVKKYSLYVPTPQDVVSVIMRSYELYCPEMIKFNSKVLPFIEALTPIDRCAFVYIADLYHLHLFNPEFVNNWVNSIAIKYNPDKNYEDALSAFNSCDELIKEHEFSVFKSITEGRDKSKLKEWMDEGVLQRFAHSAVQAEKAITAKADLIEALYLTKNLPAGTAYIATMVRRAVVGSDTDATMFSVDTLVEKRFGRLYFDEETESYASALKVLASKCMAHQNAIFSANLGVVQEKIFDISMKPEYTFPVYFQTPVAKHYFTFATVQEGLVYAESKYKWEFKGVHLKNSAHPKEVTKTAEQLMRELCLDLYHNKPLYVKKYIDECIEFEQKIKASLARGESTYFKFVDIKTAKTYRADEDTSPYKHHKLWVRVFEAKYGSVEEPDYKAIKLPLTASTNNRVKTWILSIQDAGMQRRLMTTLGEVTAFRTFYINAAYIASNGVPPELFPILDIKRCVLDLTLSRRMILSALGIYPKPGMTVSEMYGYEM